MSALRRHVLEDLAGSMRADFNSRVAEQVPAGGWTAERVHQAMRSRESFRFYSALRTCSQDLLYQTVREPIERSSAALANEATRLCRGEDAAKAAAETARLTFAEGGTGADLPRFEVPGGSIEILDALVCLGFCASRGEAKRKIAEGAVKVDDNVVSAADAVVTVSGDIKLSLGKKRHGLLVKAA